MCIIVDANRYSRFADPGDADAKPIHDWLKGGRGKIIYSDQGAFSREVSAKAREKLSQYSRAGIAEFVPMQALATDITRLRRMNIKSNDAHVLALARVSGARLLYTGDGNLISDFKNPQLINKPRGKIYSRADNADLLATAYCSN